MANRMNTEPSGKKVARESRELADYNQREIEYLTELLGKARQEIEELKQAIALLSTPRKGTKE